MRSSSLSDLDKIGKRPNALRRARGMRLSGWLDLIIAGWELALARLKLNSADPEILLAAARPASRQITAEQAQRQVERVRLAIGRVNHRVPWRADCLVQALAARNWLRRVGVETQLSIGVRDPADGPFAAHAWLKHGQLIVTGGTPADYVTLVRRGTRTDIN